MLARTDAGAAPAMADDELVIERLFAAPRALVWRIWSDSQHLKRWFGPTDFVCPVFDLDFREGGAYRGLIRAETYGDSWFGGTIVEIVPDRKLVMSFSWEDGSSQTEETTITLTLDDADGGTLLRFHQAPFASVESRNGHLGGWIECLEKGQAYAADRALETRP